MQVDIFHSYTDSVDTLIIPLSQNELAENIENISYSAGISANVFKNDFKGDKKEIFTLYNPDPLMSQRAAQKFVLVGLGAETGTNAPSPEILRQAVRSFVHKNKSRLGEHLALDLLEFSSLRNADTATIEKQVEAFVSGALLGLYHIAKFKKEPAPEVKLTRLAIFIPEALKEATEKAIHRAEIIASTQKMVFDLVNLPGNYLTAEKFAEEITDSGRNYGYDVTVLHKKEIIETGLGGLLAVNQGSKNPPTFSILEYKPANASPSTKKVALVGKGVTFDTGGISIKQSTNMHYMKCDMAGAAAVFGAVEVAARLQLPIHVIGVIPATDNMPDGTAQVPGDIINTYSGLTIEVEDTDAEGRIILADGVAYVKDKFQPEVIIDMATLTGACITALGYKAAGLFANNDDLAEALSKAGQACGERVWRMPLWDDYNDQIKSDMADVKNYGGPAAGAITAAKFIEKFIGDHSAWAHIDIAGVAFVDSEFASAKHSNAFGVRLLTEYLTALAE